MHSYKAVFEVYTGESMNLLFDRFTSIAEKYKLHGRMSYQEYSRRCTVFKFDLLGSKKNCEDFASLMSKVVR